MENEVLIVGGGVAGCAAGIALSRKGRNVTMIEREGTPRHKVCGEFLSGEALQDLHALGIDVASLGAVPIDYVRLAAARRAAEAPLPFTAASLSRKALDTALIAQATAAGVRIMSGRSVQALSRTGSGWQATLDDDTVLAAPTVFLATGKHDLRGHSRPDDPARWVAFKMYYRLAPGQAAELAGASELMLYQGGYGGIQPVEDGIANLCCVVQRKYLVSRAGGRWEAFLETMKQDCPHLAMRLAGAFPLLDKPLAITHIPYGFIRDTTEDGLYCIGDQAAVIPSFTGDGISIALHTARCAAAAYLAAEPAPVFQADLRGALRHQMRLAKIAADGLNNSFARAVLPFCLRVWPGVMRVTARLTRVAQHSTLATATATEAAANAAAA